MGGFTISGQALSVSRIFGENVNDRTGQSEAYDYNRLRVLVEDQVFDVKLDNLGEQKYQGDVPHPGQQVNLAVMLSAYKDRSGRAQITVRALRPAGPAAVAKAS